MLALLLVQKQPALSSRPPDALGESKRVALLRLRGDDDDLVAAKATDGVGLAADLPQESGAGEPIDAKRDSAFYVIRKQLRKYKVPVGVAAAFLLILVVFAVTSWIQAERNRRLAASERHAKDAAEGERRCAHPHFVRGRRHRRRRSASAAGSAG